MDPVIKSEARDRAGVSCRGWGVASLLVALVAVAALAVCVLCLDARRRDQLTELSDQLVTLRRLVDELQKQLETQEQKINSSVQMKTTAKSEHAEAYADEDEEYEYDEEESSYEYDEEDHVKKSTVKRAPLLNEKSVKSPESNSSEASWWVSTTTRRPRTRREVRADGVPVKQERTTDSYVYEKRLNQEKKSYNLRPYEPTIPGYQEQRRPTESAERLRHQHNINTRVGALENGSAEELSLTHGSKENECNILAAHFEGDTSAYNSRDHPHIYKGA